MKKLYILVGLLVFWLIFLSVINIIKKNKEKKLQNDFYNQKIMQYEYMKLSFEQEYGK